jgi:predicted nucleic acid-binding protein
VAVTVGLLDTSVFIATESGRPLDAASLPDESAVSAITIGELRWGVLMAPDDTARSRRLDTLTAAEQLEPIPVDGRVAAAWALLRQHLKAAGTRMEINDSWIAATAISYGWPLITQDLGFPSGVAGLSVVSV